MQAYVKKHEPVEPNEDKPYDTLHTSFVPIVFIPGVMGSRLEFPNGFNWDPDYPVTKMSNWLNCSITEGRRLLSVELSPTVEVMETLSSQAESHIRNDAELLEVAALFERSTASEAVALYQERGWGGISWEFYKPILLFLEKQLNHPNYRATGLHPVYAYGYDWRKSNKLSGEGLVRTVQKILAKHPGVKKVIIVTHSMGGLVARYAYACARPNLSEELLGVVHTVQPSNGAVAAYRRFFTGCVNRLDSGGDWTLNTILGDEWWKYLAYMSGLSGPMQLLPNQLYSTVVDGFPQMDTMSSAHWLITQPQVDLTNIYDEVYSKKKVPGIIRQKSELPPASLLRNSSSQLDLDYLERIWESEILPQLKKRIAEAKTFHATLKNGAHPETYIIYGNGLRTDDYVDWTQTEESDRFVQRYTGDGTVPSISGACLGFSLLREARYYQDTRRTEHDTAHFGHTEIFKNEHINASVCRYVRTILARQVP